MPDVLGVRGRLRMRSRRPPASYRPGRLLGHIDRDLPDHRMEPITAHAARFTPVVTGPVLVVSERPESHPLMGVTAGEFRVDLGGPTGDARIRLRHTGALRRSGVAGDVRRGGADAEAFLARVLGDAGFLAAVMPLDFTELTLRQDADGWHAVATLMGASEVAMRLPPTRSYVRLSADQRDALVATFTALARLVP